MHLMADAYAAAAAWLKMNDDYDNNNPDHSWDGEHDLTLTMAESLANLAENMGEPLIVVIQGGLIQGVYCTEPIGREIVVIDYDSEPSFDDELTPVPQGDDRRPVPALVQQETLSEPHDHINCFAKEYLGG